MEFLATWFANTLGQLIPAEWVCFIVSMIPVLELRGGLVVSSLLQVPYLKALIFCIIGNIIPIPFILLFIEKFLNWTKKWAELKGPLKLVGKFSLWLEKKANSKSGALEKGEFLGLMLFVGIPLPGTGAWTGSLIAALFHIKLWKAVLAELCGLILATAIMSFITYGLPWIATLF